MKKLVLFTLLVINGITFLYSQRYSPHISNLSHPSSVDVFDLFEISFTIPINYPNPYDPEVVDVTAVFFGPNNIRDTVCGFYYEGYNLSYYNGYEVAVANPSANGWRIRYTPRYPGTWYFCIRVFSIVPSENNSGTDRTNYHFFTCNSVNNANGFISKANSRFLKRDVIINGQRQNHSFFPVGPNIGWYYCKDEGTYSQPRGIYSYQRRIDSLYNNANYMRIWISRYQYLSLYGLEYTQLENGNPKMYFDSIINQKDSAELDSIIDYASRHGISIMPCLFTFGDFTPYDNAHPDVSVWENNPYHTILGLQTPCDFFSEEEAYRVTKNLIRYIVARWGYATNIMAWELWNEVGKLFDNCPGTGFQKSVIKWHNEMANYIREIDPFHHCITTSTTDTNSVFYHSGFNTVDFVQYHDYKNIDYARSDKQLPYIAYKDVQHSHNVYPTKPVFLGELDFSQGDSLHMLKDPFGIELHNHLWSTFFSSGIGVSSNWWWDYLNIKGLFHLYAPIYTFSQNLPILSGSFSGYCTGEQMNDSVYFHKNIEVYYIKNQSDDTIIGWCQDNAFSYQSLRRLTDYVNATGTLFIENGVFDPNGYVYTLNPSKRPQPSVYNNQIVFRVNRNFPSTTEYLVSWYNTESGEIYPLETTVVTIQSTLSFNYIVIEIPSSIINIQQQTVNNTFGDAVFVITRLHL